MWAERPKRSNIGRLTTPGKRCYKGSKPTDCFVVLPPNGVYETETGTDLFVVRDDNSKIAGGVRSGEHAIQIEVITWTESNELADRVRERWRRFGALWNRPIRSDPMLITLEKHRKVSPCQ